MTTISPTDRDVLRRLAARYREIADSENNHVLQQRWTAHNDLEPGGLPLVLSEPEGAWTEILGGCGSMGDGSRSLVSDPGLRGIEWWLRSRLYSREVLKDDHAFDPWFDVNWSVAHGDFGVVVLKHQGDNRGSWKSEPPIKDLAKDLHKLRPRQPRVDREATYRQVSEANAIFGDLLPTRIRPSLWWTDGMTWDVIDLIGLDRLMTAMLDEPDELHALMAWMRDERLAWTTWFEREGLLGSRNQGDGIGSGGLGYTRQLPGPDHVEGTPLTFRDCWGFAESQETVGVSPRHFNQFVLPYQVPLVSRYGLNCYGCCEGLEKRIDFLFAQIPRLRRVSVSPWANQEIMAQKLGRRAVFSRKPSPVLVCSGFNEQAIREDLRTTLRVSAGCNVDIIMKDTHTVEGEPWRLARWVEIAKEEIVAWAEAGHAVAM